MGKFSNSLSSLNPRVILHNPHELEESNMPLLKLFWSVLRLQDPTEVHNWSEFIHPYKPKPRKFSQSLKIYFGVVLLSWMKKKRSFLFYAFLSQKAARKLRRKRRNSFQPDLQRWKKYYETQGTKSPLFFCEKCCEKGAKNAKSEWNVKMSQVRRKCFQQNFSAFR